MRTHFMASKAQIAWRKKFARMSKAGKFKKSSKKLEKQYVQKIKKEGMGKYGDKNQKIREKELNAIFRARIRESNDPVVKKALRNLMFKKGGAKDF